MQAQTCEKSEINRHDLQAPRREWWVTLPSAADKTICNLLRDTRDAPIARMLANVMFLVVPAAGYAFASESHFIGGVYLACNLLLMQERFILGLHYATHRPLFRAEGAGRCLVQSLGVLYGLPPGVYYLHHVVMHHGEHNLFPHDLSSTAPYCRDNFAHFLVYWARFLCAVWLELPVYALARARYRLALQSIASTACTALAYWRLWLWHPTGTLWVLVLPLVVGSFVLMFGNWSQHIFINPARPASAYGYTYNSINCAHNQSGFNDGYHVEHHLNPRRHWSELPAAFAHKLDAYRQHEALVFRGVGFFEVGCMVFLRRYRTLASHVLPLCPTLSSPLAAEQVLRARVWPIPSTQVPCPSASS
jgi:hypothetical protein